MSTFNQVARLVRQTLTSVVAVVCLTSINVKAQTDPQAPTTQTPTSAQTAADLNESERSDRFTGGLIETAEFVQTNRTLVSL